MDSRGIFITVEIRKELITAYSSLTGDISKSLKEATLYSPRCQKGQKAHSFLLKRESHLTSKCKYSTVNKMWWHILLSAIPLFSQNKTTNTKIRNSPKFLTFSNKRKVGTFSFFFLFWYQSSQMSHIFESSALLRATCKGSKECILGSTYSIGNIKTITWLHKQWWRFSMEMNPLWSYQLY